MRSKAEMLVTTGDALSKITTDGWNSRAADRFREKFETEPERWRTAGDGFLTAASSLEAYAAALESAQQRARWAQGEYARGEQVTESARSAYDADVARARDEVNAAASRGQLMTLTIVPFQDPGESIRQSALAEYAGAKADLEAAAHTCADGVRAGCSAAPEERKWYESVGAAVGGFLVGAGEALLDLGKLVAFLGNPAAYLFMEMSMDAAGGMTAEEIAAKNRLRLEDAEGLLDALRDDPVEFGRNIGKAMLDWDTWADDPARALGHLVPDAIAAVATGGAGAAATRGVKGGADAVDALSDLSRLSDVADVRHLDDLADLADLRRLDDLDALTAYDDVPAAPQGTWRGLDDPALEAWLDDVTTRHPELSRDGVRGVWDYTTDDGYTRMNAEMRSPGGADAAAVQQRIERADAGLDQLPSYEGTTYRGTNLPDAVVERMLVEGRYSDEAFSSSSLNPDVSEGFVKLNRENPTFMTIQGHSGVNVAPFSAARTEVEILFRGGAEFEVLDTWVRPDGVREFTLRELRR